jgi:hypothetical protein
MVRLAINGTYSYAQQCDTMKHVFIWAQILGYAKTTHERTIAIQYGASRGLSSTQIASFTKHRLDQMHKVYIQNVIRLR